jgi:hypothetical protein
MIYINKGVTVLREIKCRLESKEIYLISILLYFLIIPRILAYLSCNCYGIAAVDATDRYFPQVEKLEESFFNFFALTGPAYSAILYFFKNMFNDMITGTVILQHVAGVVSGVLTFFFFKRTNKWLAFLTSILVYSSQRSAIIEHFILRDSLTAFLLILLIVLFLAPRTRYFINDWPMLSGIVGGIIGMALVFMRIEYIVLIIALPLGHIIKRCRFDRQLLNSGDAKYIVGYFLPLLIVITVYVTVKDKYAFQQYSGTYFNIAYHSLDPSVFNYKGSRHPELLKVYQNILRENENVSQSMSYLYDATRGYLSQHQEINLTLHQLMDRMFVEMIFKNPLGYLKSYFVNLKNMMVGNAYLESMRSFPKASFFTKCIYGSLSFPTYIFDQKTINRIIVCFFVVGIPYLLLKSKQCDFVVFISAFITVFQLLLLAFIANPVARFRYPVDPLLYFPALYGFYSIVRTKPNIKVTM